MNIEQTENALCGLIASLGIAAKPYPQAPGNYLPNTEPGEALVRYSSQVPGKRDLSSVYVPREYVFEILIVSRRLRGSGGLYENLEKIAALLEGYTLEGAAGPLEMTLEDFVDEYNGTWQYGQKWKFKRNTLITQQDAYGDDDIRKKEPGGEYPG